MAMSNYNVSDVESDEDLHAIKEALEGMTESHRMQTRVVILKHRSQVHRPENDCPCQHNPNCPYRQETERLKKLNKSWEYELRATKIRLDLLTEANEEMKTSINELKNMIVTNKDDSEKREREDRAKIMKLEQDIIDIKSKME